MNPFPVLDLLGYPRLVGGVQEREAAPPQPSPQEDEMCPPLPPDQLPGSNLVYFSSFY